MKKYSIAILNCFEYCNPWTMRGLRRTATKLAIVHATRAKQPKHRRGRRAQARAYRSRVASPTRGAGAMVEKVAKCYKS